MDNPIKPQPLIVTPKDHAQLQSWIMAHNTDERAHLLVAAGMAWNLASQLVDEALDEETTQP